MSQSNAIRGRIDGLREELAKINPAHPWNAERIASRQRGLAGLEAQLERVERMHETFLAHRAALVARHHDFAARNGGR